jgi:hypothetical protein
VVRAVVLVAEKVPQLPGLLAQPVQLPGQGGKVWMCGGRLLLAGGLAGEQLPFPVPQRRRVFVVLLADGGRPWLSARPCGADNRSSGGPAAGG